MDTEIEIRDQRKHRWYWIDARLIRRDAAALGLAAIAVYNVLSSYAHNDTQKAFPGVRSIAKMLGISPTTVHEAIERLEKNHWIIVNREGKSEDNKRHLPNVYTLVDAPSEPAVAIKMQRKGDTAAVSVPQRTQGDTARVTDQSLSIDPERISPETTKKTNGRARDLIFERILFNAFGITYIPKMHLEKSIKGLANKLTAAVKEVHGTETDVDDYYGGLRDMGLTLTLDAGKLQQRIKQRVLARETLAKLEASAKERAQADAAEYDRIFGD